MFVTLITYFKQRIDFPVLRLSRVDSNTNYMGKYSIKDLENLSGIKAHTIRIWEQRYDIVTPKRTPTNIRYYDSSDLKLILKVAMLRKEGVKISKIAAMSPEELNAEIENLGPHENESGKRYIHSLTNAMLELDEFLFERTLSTCILQMGLETTMYEVIQPFLIKIGQLWQTDSVDPAQEHFITCLLRQKLIVAIDGQRTEQHADSKKFVLYLPEGELHELTLLFSCYVLKKEGHQVLYLGQNMPFTELKAAYTVYKPHYLLSILTTFPKMDDIQQYVDDLSANFSKATILLSGFGILHSDPSIPANVHVIRALNELREYLPVRESAVT
jgi:DNA-binding transcriptional MerR regulator